jgi:thiamine-phosphate pyrophosphorylase
MLADRRPILCLITDRRRLCPSSDERTALRSVAAQVRDAVEAGIDIVQVREGDLETAALWDLVATAVDLARGSTTRIVVNDRLDVALASGAAGVHLRSDSIPPSSARPICPPGFIIGRSVHSRDEAVRASADVDYLIAGTVYSTRSKGEAVRLLGERGLSEVATSVGVPVLAIGGVTTERLAAVAAIGAAGIAAIGLFIGEEPSSGVRRTARLKEIVSAARASYDTWTAS